jgi:hypothetical protein
MDGWLFKDYFDCRDYSAPNKMRRIMMSGLRKSCFKYSTGMTKK